MNGIGQVPEPILWPFLHKTSVDVVLCDSIDPTFYGIEVMSLVRRQQPNAAFIFLTGQSELEALEALRKSGADGVLSKGNLRAIGEIITSAVTRRRIKTGTNT